MNTCLLQRVKGIESTFNRDREVVSEEQERTPRNNLGCWPGDSGKSWPQLTISTGPGNSARPDANHSLTKASAGKK
jgi:hypothetical protein